MANSFIETTELLPVDIVLAPPWWHHNASITFDEDFFYNPAKRVESEKKMEKLLYEKWGQFGLGSKTPTAAPQVGPVHLAAGYLLSEMLGCKIEYSPNTPPAVIPANRDNLDISASSALQSNAYKKFEKLLDSLKTKHNYLTGDINFSGILNLALDIRGQNLFMDMFDKPQKVTEMFSEIASLIETFTSSIQKQTNTTSISVNRNVRHIKQPVLLHSECSHTMISVEDYEKYLMPFDISWSQNHRPFGIHFCGPDPHRFAKAFAKIPNLDFLDVGWPGDVAMLRKHLPNTFLNLRLSPVEIIEQSPEEISQTIRKLVADSTDPNLTGICCINMDEKVSDEKISAIFKTAQELRKSFSK